MTATTEAVIGLSGPQGEVFESEARFRVLIAGRRFGKTYLASAELVKAAVATSGALCWYVSPTYGLARDTTWPMLKALVPWPYVLRANETDFSLELKNGSKIALRSADRPDRLRGVGLDLLVMDEFTEISPSAWTEVLRPALADREGRALFIGTPKGFNWAYDLYVHGQDGDANWASWQFRTIDGGRVTPEEVELSRATSDPRIFAQEFLASFETLQGRVYSNFKRAQWPEGNVDTDVVDTGAELLVGMDFNIDPMSCVIGVKAGDELHILDAWELPISNTEEMAAVLKEKYPGRSLIICPDPSANQRRTSAPTGQTDITILKRAGFQVDVASSAPLIVDRVNNTQANLLAGDRRRVHIHPRAEKYLRALDGLTYKEGTNLPNKGLKPPLDHIADAGDYLLWQRFNLLEDRTVRQREFLI
jgi:hypothetical protein